MEHNKKVKSLPEEYERKKKNHFEHDFNVI